jgi:hypothetical protein
MRRIRAPAGSSMTRNSAVSAQARRVLTETVLLTNLERECTSTVPNPLPRTVTDPDLYHWHAYCYPTFLINSLRALTE